MARFVLTKFAGAILTLLFALTIAFLLAHASGNPVYNMLGPTAPRSQIIALQRQLGLNHSFIYQYGAYLNSLLHFHLGSSLEFLQSNWSLIWSRLPNSIELLGCAMFLAVIIGVPLGIVAAIKRGTIWDRIASTLALLGQSVPIFWLGIMFILIFSVKLNWLPAGQKGGFTSYILPSVGLSLLPLAQIARLMRATMSEVLGEPYMDAAKARGLSWSRTILNHALRNASLPVITIISLQMGTLLSGAIAVEYVFGWPGIGTLAINAIQFHDYALIQAIVIVGVLSFVLLNLLVDILYGIIDPRIRDGAK